MENGFQRIFLRAASALCLSLLAASAFGAADPEDLELEPLVVREPDRRQVEIDQLDSENIEIGVYGGIMSVQDFGSDTVVGARLAYHITEDFYVEGSYGQTTLGQTSFERLSGGAQILTDEERDMSYYNVSLGWNIFPGEAFVGRGFAFKGGLYLIGGVGSTDFGGDNRFTINAGVGYRLIATDWLALHVTLRDHIFDSDLLGEKDTLHNLEFSGGLTVFF